MVTQPVYKDYSLTITVDGSRLPLQWIEVVFIISRFLQPCRNQRKTKMLFYLIRCHIRFILVEVTRASLFIGNNLSDTSMEATKMEAERVMQFLVKAS